MKLHSFPCACPAVPAAFAEWTVFPTLNGLGAIAENQLTIDNMGLFFNSSVDLCLYLCQNHNLDYLDLFICSKF